MLLLPRLMIPNRKTFTQPLSNIRDHCSLPLFDLSRKGVRCIDPRTHSILACTHSAIFRLTPFLAYQAFGFNPAPYNLPCLCDPLNARNATSSVSSRLPPAERIAFPGASNLSLDAQGSTASVMQNLLLACEAAQASGRFQQCVRNRRACNALVFPGRNQKSRVSPVFVRRECPTLASPLPTKLRDTKSK